MNRSELFVRPGLQATRRGVPNPRQALEVGLDRIVGSLVAWQSGPQAELAYQLLVAWARLRRVRPELIAACGGEAVVQRLVNLVAAEGHRLVDLGLHVPDPDGWLQQARNLDEIFEHAEDPAEVVQHAETLLGALDDLELALYAVGQVGRQDERLRDGVERCRNEAFDGTKTTLDNFAQAVVFVQTVGLTLRPDLEDFDPALARTAEKFVLVLDVLEAEACDFSKLPATDLPTTLLDGLLREVNLAGTEPRLGDQPVAGPRRRLADWLPAPASVEYAIAASTAQPAQPGVELRWKSPTGDAVAIFAPDTTRSYRDEDEVLLSFWRAESEDTPALSLIGQTAVLAGVAMTIQRVQQQGVNRVQLVLPMGILRLLGAQPPTLAVGSDQDLAIEWPLAEAGAE